MSLMSIVPAAVHQCELFWFGEVYRARVHRIIRLFPALIAAVCEQELETFFSTEHRCICQRVGPWRTASASDIPPLTGEEVRVRTGRRMLGGKGEVQGSWRPRYWTGFLVCKVNRIWMDRICISLQVLINEWSLNHPWWSWLITWKLIPAIWY